MACLIKAVDGREAVKILKMLKNKLLLISRKHVA